MKKTLAALLSSRKFLVMVGSVVAYAASRVGFDVPVEATLPALGLAASYIFGTALEDAAAKRGGNVEGAAQELKAAAAAFEKSLATMKMPP